MIKLFYRRIIKQSINPSVRTMSTAEIEDAHLVICAERKSIPVDGTYFIHLIPLSFALLVTNLLLLCQILSN